MAPTIRVDDEVYDFLKSNAEPFHDTPNLVLRRLLGLASKTPAPSITASPRLSGRKTPQSAFREPILRVLARRGGEGRRM